MTKVSDVRRLALALPEAHEADHHGFPSFRVEDKIFATLPDDEHLHVMLDQEETREAVDLDPLAIEELMWGKKLAGVRVALAEVDRALVAELLRKAWRRKAPRRLLSGSDG